MTAKTHLVAGMLAGEAIILRNGGTDSLPTIAMVMLASCVGSIVPDIDMRQSSVSTISLSTRAVSGATRIFTRHRGFTHTPLFCLLAFTLSLAAASKLLPSHSYILAYSICAGTLSHLILDTLNYKGIMWLYPLSKKRFHFMNIRTKSSSESIFAAILSIPALLGIGMLLYLFNIDYWRAF